MRPDLLPVIVNGMYVAKVKYQIGPYSMVQSCYDRESKGQTWCVRKRHRFARYARRQMRLKGNL